MVVDGRGRGEEGEEPMTCATVCFKESLKQLKMSKKETGLDILWSSQMQMGKMEDVDETSAQ
jgi:hypothetical protein